MAGIRDYKDFELQNCYCIPKLILGKVCHQEVGSENMWGVEPYAEI